MTNREARAYVRARTVKARPCLCILFLPIAMLVGVELGVFVAGWLI